MLKRITTAIAALALSAPAMAYPTGLDQNHQYLWNTLQSKGVVTYINPKEICQQPDKDVDGAYFYAEQADLAVLVVCQDNRTKVDQQEVAWTANDLDTIRHESMHFLQDCLDGKIDMELRPFYDGPGGAPGDLTAEDIQRRLGSVRSDYIAYTYGEIMGADALTIRLEHEAFFVADNIDPVTIGQAIRAFCEI